MLFGYVQRDLFENSRDSAARDAELGRETAGRWEPGASAEATDRYGLPQRRRELSVDRDRRRTVDLRHPQRGSRRHGIKCRAAILAALLDHGAPQTRTSAAHLTKVALGA